MPEVDHQFIIAATIVATWMEKYKRYLLDGDPNVVHPKARAELTLMIAEALATAKKVAIGEPIVEPEFLAPKKKPKGKQDDTAKEG